MMKNTVIAVLLGMVLFVLVIKFFFTVSKNLSRVDHGTKICDAYTNVVNSEIKGVIEKVYVDEANHNFKKVLINDGKQVNTLYLDFDLSGLFGYTAIGDSIVKLSDTNKVHIFRDHNETLFNLDFGCSE